MTIRIIDYGSGNLHSVLKAFQKQAEKHGLNAELTQDPDALQSASHIVLPGVGAFGDCVAGLCALDGMREALEEAVMQTGKPFFGICVGMQMMLERGLEHGDHQGLGWIKGDVVPLLKESTNHCQEPAKAVDPFVHASAWQIVGDYTASGPRSPVRIRTASSIEDTKILPSPILPVCAAFIIASMVFST